MEEMLELQAGQMAEKALSGLPEEARSAKFEAVKQGILKRLKADASAKALAKPSPAAQEAPAAKRLRTEGAAVAGGAKPPGPAKPLSGGAKPTAAAAAATAPPISKSLLSSTSAAKSSSPAAKSGPTAPTSSKASAPQSRTVPPALKSPPSQASVDKPLDVLELPLSTSQACDAAMVTAQKGAIFAEAMGDDPWFNEASFIRRLCETSAAAHADQKILVAAPVDEIRRICPGEGRMLGAGAVLRLGGARHGGYSEADVGYAYRQLSRALHPDKNPGIPEAHDAFRRLSEAADELRKGLAESRQLVGRLRAALGEPPGDAAEPPAAGGMMERPQAALVAEACRVLAAVLSLTGEGSVSDAGRSHALQAFVSSSAFGRCHVRHFLSSWYDGAELLDQFSGAVLRSAYDSLPKRFRTQFLCMLNRVAAAEAARNESCVRGTWQGILAQFPEVGLWRDLLDIIRRRAWLEGVSERHETRKSKWDQQDEKEIVVPDEPSPWGRAWRSLILDVLPAKPSAAAPVSDRDLHLLGEALWRDVADWAVSNGATRHLKLFSTEPATGDGDIRSSEWVFVPVADLLLTVGEGLVGITASGIYAEADGSDAATRNRLSFAAALRKARRGTYRRGLALPTPAQVKEAKSRGPTRIVLLTNMVGPGQVDADLQEETADEAVKYGKLKKCTITESKGAPDNEAVRIFLEFETIEGASKAYSDMNGRYFAGRRVKARFFDVERYEKGNLDRRAPTRFLHLVNLVGPADSDQELEIETAEEASRFGEVKSCLVREAPGAPEDQFVNAFIEFSTEEAAAAAQAAWRGRIIDGRELRVRFVESLADAQSLMLPPAVPRNCRSQREDRPAAESGAQPKSGVQPKSAGREHLRHDPKAGAGVARWVDAKGPPPQAPSGPFVKGGRGVGRSGAAGGAGSDVWI